jgi:hypothetical protein
MNNYTNCGQRFCYYGKTTDNTNFCISNNTEECPLSRKKEDFISYNFDEISKLWDRWLASSRLNADTTDPIYPLEKLGVKWSFFIDKVFGPGTSVAYMKEDDDRKRKNLEILTERAANEVKKLILKSE